MARQMALEAQGKTRPQAQVQAQAQVQPQAQYPAQPRYQTQPQYQPSQPPYQVQYQPQTADTRSSPNNGALGLFQDSAPDVRSLFTHGVRG